MPHDKIFSDGHDSFKTSYFKNHEKELLDLAQNGQHPKALFIGCSDSRVVPNLITQTDPGDLFIVRNVGNFVAPYSPEDRYHATAPGIEYAVSVLGVSEIIICGHTNCGAIHSLFQKIDDPNLIHTKKWLHLGEKAKSFALMSLGKDADEERLCRLTEKLSVVSQIENLLTYPSVRKAVEEDTIHIHGWLYHIDSGDIDYYDPDAGVFKKLSDLKEEK